MSEFKQVTQHLKRAVVRVYEVSEVDPDYATVLIQLPGDYSLEVTPTDAQRIGHAINSAGGGVLAKEAKP